jgi:peptidyl-prolyl cis-trans isomerase B (cyclophilin B)
MFHKLLISIVMFTFIAGLAIAKGKEVGIISTKFGDIVIEFFPKEAPNHVKNFKKLASSGFYDGCTFHRVIPDFMIQGGDPNSKDDDRTNDGMGSPGYTINAEFNSIHHNRGIVSMARAQDPNSAGSQFFIVVKDSRFLDKQYTVFGKVIEGMEVADKIKNVPRDKRDNPFERVEMTVKITDYDEYKASKKTK